MQTYPNNLCSYTRLAAFAAFCFFDLALTIRAQDATPVTAASEDVVHLEEFRVTTELGRYADVSSAAATKTPIELIDLPSSVKILNSSFLADVRAPRLEDSFGYVVALNKGSTSANGFTLRGFSAHDSNLSTLQVHGLPVP